MTSAKEGKAGVFFAFTDKNNGHKGITAFLVPLDIPGVEIGIPEEKMGIRATSTCDILLKNVKIPQTHIMGGLGNGFEIAMRQLQIGRIGVSAQAIGIAQAAFELAVKYSCNRTVFNERLCDKQLVKVSFINILTYINIFSNKFLQNKLAKMATDLESARLLCKF